MRENIQSSTVISDCKNYRYLLTRTWSDIKPAVFVMLRPLVPDPDKDDAVTLRCMEFAEQWCRGGIVIINLFAYCTSHPSEFLATHDPVGPENLDYIHKAAQGQKYVVCAWGDKGSFLKQDQKIASCIQRAGAQLACLEETRHGKPRHTLDIPKGTRLLPKNWSFRE